MVDKFVQPSVNALPGHLNERTRRLNHRPASAGAEFVLYWMHHAVRDHENPALETALWIADHLRLPVLVYQGLGGRHPYNNDRHHTFILQGAREIENALTARGITYAFHLAKAPGDPSPLVGLISRAALTVTEDFPAPPINRWTRRLAAVAPTAFWSVDTACILPMQSVPKSVDRAFQFRQATWEAYAERISKPYPTLSVTSRPFQGGLGFLPLDLATADISDCCAACHIDHTVGPVDRTQGGSEAGYQRWEQFKQEGLRDYDQTRNDAALAFPSSVSRMSAYLHHGHVAPFRIVREAAMFGGRGAKKYLDEILIWRELAHNFCFYNDQPGILDALPSWAQKTLSARRHDPRPATLTWEELARGRTGDSLWDAAQKSLLIHGELHNNLRMTWGKALLQWTRSPGEALRMMIDLNHCFALDGSDPNSYAGILWCLGLFDRPFKPPRPVIGTLRPRSTRSHAARLNLSRYRARISQPASGLPLRVAVIGAGLSGLIAGRLLADHGHRVRVFEKSRGLGGRLTTRRLESCAFDHGAQYFTVKDQRFGQWVDSWRQLGVVGQWEGRIGVLKQGAFKVEKNRHGRFVGVPGMSALAGHLAKDLNIQLNTKVQRIRQKGSATVLCDDSNHELGDFDALIVSAPPEQSRGLLNHLTPLADQLHRVRMMPCWAVMVAYSEPLELAFDGAFVHGSTLAWAARNSSKPGRESPDCWVLHATAGWSLDHIDLNADAVISCLMASFSAAVAAPLPEPVFSAAHRWRYAQAQQPLKAGCLWDRQSMIGICGDWCYGSRIEGAFLSGAAVAGRLLAH